MEAEYYPFCYRLDGQVWYLIWYESDPDGVVTIGADRVPVFSSLEALMDYAGQLSLNVEAPSEGPPLDLDEISNRIGGRSLLELDPHHLNYAWNTFDDVMMSIRGTKVGYVRGDREEIDDVYMKLFYSLNLPVLTPEGEYYLPLWDEEEGEIMAQVLREGLGFFEDSILPWPAP